VVIGTDYIGSCKFSYHDVPSPYLAGENTLSVTYG